MRVEIKKRDNRVSHFSLILRRNHYQTKPTTASCSTKVENKYISMQALVCSSLIAQKKKKKSKEFPTEVFFSFFFFVFFDLFAFWHLANAHAWSEGIC